MAAAAAAGGVCHYVEVPAERVRLVVGHKQRYPGP